MENPVDVKPKYQHFCDPSMFHSGFEKPNYLVQYFITHRAIPNLADIINSIHCEEGPLPKSDIVPEGLGILTHKVGQRTHKFKGRPQ